MAEETKPTVKTVASADKEAEAKLAAENEALKAELAVAKAKVPKHPSWMYGAKK